MSNLRAADSAMYSTGGAAAIVGVSRERLVQILRESGLDPQIVRDSAGRRLLTSEDIEAVRRIRRERSANRATSGEP